MDGSRSRCRLGRRPQMLLTAGACAVALTLMSGCSGAAPSAVSPAASSGAFAPSPPGAEAGAPRAEDGLESDYQRVIQQVLPSVVQIDASQGLGSGVVYDDRGHVVTNAHVVGDEKTFKVTVATGGEVLGAKLVADYPEQDLAVLKLDNVPDGLRPARFADTSVAEVGQIVLAMGSPLGLSSSVTQGIVSAVGRTVSEGRTGGGTGATLANLVQTSAAINPGNSGGALVNLAGQVVGIPTLAATDPDLGGSSAPGIGFAIPASMVKTVADQIIKSGRVTDSGRAALDIAGRTVVNNAFEPAGVAVVSTKPGGAAADAGIRAGDIVTGIDNDAVTSMTSLSEALAAKKPGDEVRVTYQRDDRERSAEVTLGEI
ncbi:S1C family serine protease [Streptomyces hypolithicus]